MLIAKAHCVSGTASSCSVELSLYLSRCGAVGPGVAASRRPPHAGLPTATAASRRLDKGRDGRAKTKRSKRWRWNNASLEHFWTSAENVRIGENSTHNHLRDAALHRHRLSVPCAGAAVAAVAVPSRTVAAKVASASGGG